MTTVSGKTIAVDVDDTVAQLVPMWVKKIIERHPTCPNPIGRSDWDTWSLDSQIPGYYHDSMWKILNTQDLYDDVEPVAGALAGIKSLRNANHRVVFVTSCAVGHAGAKLRWLVRHGFLHSERAQGDYVEAYDKTLIRADVIIDDRPRTCHKFAKLNGPASAVLFMPRHLCVDERGHLPYVTGWEHVPSEINRLLSGVVLP